MEKRNFRDCSFSVYRCDSPDATQLVIMHGICEHSYRYIPFIKALNKQGFDCTLIDHPGHGQNISSNPFTDSFFQLYDSLEDDLVKSLEGFTETTLLENSKGFQKSFTKKNKTLKLDELISFQKEFITFLFKEKVYSRNKATFLLGQSMGGLITVALGEQIKDLNGIILLSPALKASAKPLENQSAKERIRHKMETKVIDKSDESFDNSSLFKTLVLSPLLSLNPVNDSSWAADYISDIPEVNELFSKDPFIGRKLSLKFLQSIQREMKLQREMYREYEVPVFIEFGSDDKVVNPEGSHDFIHRRLNGNKHFFKALSDYEPHEIHNSKRRNYLINDIKEWTDSLN